MPPIINNFLSFVTIEEWFISPNGNGGNLNLDLPMTSILFDNWNGHPPITKIHLGIDNPTVIKSEVAYEL